MSNTRSVIRGSIKSSVELRQKLIDSGPFLSEVEKASDAIIKAFKENRKLLLAGNGGSAADSQHIAAEFVNRFYLERPGLPAVALTTDTSVLTSIGNDYGFDKVFARQVMALGAEGDVFIGISTSGNSKNLIEAFKACAEKKIVTIGLTGSGGGMMGKLCDICIIVPSDETPRIQEVHILTGHIICSIVESELFGSHKSPK
ncbi:MAG: D-sedoheptulose 7-phosphate isomerase [Bacteroidales bacterium]|jgi:D-sedoheptulose 7-phosphate isomerase